MSTAIRILIQMALSKQGRSVIKNVLLGILFLFLLPMFLIGGALASVTDMVQDDTDMFAKCKTVVREEMKIENDLDPLFVRWLILSNNDEDALPNEQAIQFIIQIAFVKAIGNETEPTYLFLTEEEIFQLLESPDMEIPADQLTELKELIALRDEMKAGQKMQKSAAISSPHDKRLGYAIPLKSVPIRGYKENGLTKPFRASDVPISNFQNFLMSPKVGTYKISQLCWLMWPGGDTFVPTLYPA